MRLEYRFALDEVEVPRFSVEAVEGIGKLFTLATLVMNVLDTKERVELVFHGLNPDDPERKIRAFHEILSSSGHSRDVNFEPGRGGQVPGSSSYFQWLTLRTD
jgi:hypothetical protein